MGTQAVLKRPAAGNRWGLTCHQNAVVTCPPGYSRVLSDSEAHMHTVSLSWHGGGRRYSMGLPGTRGRPRVRVFVCAIGSCALAAGVTWTSRTASAPWVSRIYLTSVIDAAGAIYVLGGYSSTYLYLNDVWVSTDGGA
jgi:hypothetical protein